MPLEGHWNRQQTPLRLIPRRERRTLTVIGAVVAAAILALGAYLLFADTSPSGPRAGCVNVTGATSTGGAKIHACGRGASRLCATTDPNTPLGRALQPQCARNRLHTPAR